MRLDGYVSPPGRSPVVYRGIVSCLHGNVTQADGLCPCDGQCFCHEHGACRDLDETVGPRTNRLLLAGRETTVELKPPGEPVRLEIDLEDPDAVAGFLEEFAKSVRARRRLVMIIE